MKQYTDITILLDRSGSMVSIKESMETAYDKFIKEHSAVPSTRISLVQFDDTNPQDIVYQGVPVQHVDPLKIKPRGNTPLLDAMCQLIDRTGQRFADMSESDRPDQVLMVIITDGQENASTKHSRKDVSNRVTKQRDDFKWQFVYLGANQDAIAEAASFGIPSGNAMSYRISSAGSGTAMAATMANTVAFAQSPGGLRGMSVNSYTNDQRVKAADNDPSIDITAGQNTNLILKNKLKNKQTTKKV